jgi:hypothetical protein
VVASRSWFAFVFAPLEFRFWPGGECDMLVDDEAVFGRPRADGIEGGLYCCRGLDRGAVE